MSRLLRKEMAQTAGIEGEYGKREVSRFLIPFSIVAPPLRAERRCGLLCGYAGQANTEGGTLALLACCLDFTAVS